MKAGTQLETDRLIIRHWTLSPSDRAFFHYINSNAIGRKFYPTRLDRTAADQRLEELVAMSATRDLIWAVALLKDTGQAIGYTGLSRIRFERNFSADVEIGWQFDPNHWGQGYATETAKALLQHGFSDVGLDEIVAFAVHDNHASVAVMRRIGMQEVENGAFDHPPVPDSHPHLKHHVLYAITRSQWRNGRHSGNGLTNQAISG